MDVNAKLTVLSEQLRGTIFQLDDDVCRIGRSDEMEIQLIDSTVSGYHCHLERSVNGKVTYWVVDEQQSTNGTRINGEPVSRQPLVNGDILQVGSVECMYESDSDLAPDTSSTNTEIKLEEDVWEMNSGTQNLKPKKWQTDDRQMKMGIKITIWVLVFTVLGMVTWLVMALLAKPA